MQTRCGQAALGDAGDAVGHIELDLATSKGVRPPFQLREVEGRFSARRMASLSLMPTSSPSSISRWCARPHGAPHPRACAGSFDAELSLTRPWIHRALAKSRSRNAEISTLSKAPWARSSSPVFRADQREPPFKVPSWKSRARGTLRCGPAAPARSPPCRRGACGRTGRSMPRVAGLGRWRWFATRSMLPRSRCRWTSCACAIGIARSERSTSSAASVPVIDGRSPSSRTRQRCLESVAAQFQPRPRATKVPVCPKTACPPRKAARSERTEWEIEAAPTGEVADGAGLDRLLPLKRGSAPPAMRAVDGELHRVQEGLSAKAAGPSRCETPAAAEVLPRPHRFAAERRRNRRCRGDRRLRPAQRPTLMLSRPSSGRSSIGRTDLLITRRSIGALAGGDLTTRLAQSRDRQIVREALRRLSFTDTLPTADPAEQERPDFDLRPQCPAIGPQRCRIPDRKVIVLKFDSRARQNRKGAAAPDGELDARNGLSDVRHRGRGRPAGVSTAQLRPQEASATEGERKTRRDATFGRNRDPWSRPGGGIRKRRQSVDPVSIGFIYA